MENWRQYLTESTIQNALLAFMLNMRDHEKKRPADIKTLSDEELLRYIKTHNHMIDDDELFNFIRSLTEEMIEEGSGVLSNIFKFCSAGTKCPPESKKTKWWKGR